MNLRELQGVVATDKHEQDAYVKPRAKTRAGLVAAFNRKRAKEKFYASARQVVKIGNLLRNQNALLEKQTVYRE